MHPKKPPPFLRQFILKLSLENKNTPLLELDNVVRHLLHCLICLKAHSRDGIVYLFFIITRLIYSFWLLAKNISGWPRRAHKLPHRIPWLLVKYQQRGIPQNPLIYSFLRLNRLIRLYLTAAFEWWRTNQPWSMSNIHPLSKRSTQP